MLYQLPDGRTIEISLDDYLKLSDQELKDLVGLNYGMAINNPLYGSYITKPSKVSKKNNGNIDTTANSEPKVTK